MRFYRFNIPLAASVAIALFSGQLQAADENGRFAFKGAGLGTCAQFMEHKASGSRDFYIYAGWIEGYLTGLNRLKPNTYDLAPWQSTEVLTGMLETFCTKNPQANFASAVDQLGIHLNNTRLKQGSELIQVTYKSSSVLIYREILIDMQNKLQSDGFLKDFTSGSFDEKTALGLMEFQRRNGLAANGLPSAITLHKLFAASERSSKKTN